MYNSHSTFHYKSLFSLWKLDTISFIIGWRVNRFMVHHLYMYFFFEVQWSHLAKKSPCRERLPHMSRKFAACMSHVQSSLCHSWCCTDRYKDVMLYLLLLMVQHAIHNKSSNDIKILQKNWLNGFVSLYIACPTIKPLYAMSLQYPNTIITCNSK